MKRIIMKIVQITHVILSTIFVVMFMGTILGFIPVNVLDGRIISDNYLKIILVMLTIIYGILSVYLMINAFVSTSKVKYVRIAGNLETVAYVNTKILKVIAQKASKIMTNIKVLKINVYSNDENSISINILIDINADDIIGELEKFRLMLVDSFFELLGIRFASINFKTNKIKTNYTPDLEKIQKKADDLKRERERQKQLQEEREKQKQARYAQQQKEAEEREKQKREQAEKQKTDKQGKSDQSEKDKQDKQEKKENEEKSEEKDKSTDKISNSEDIVSDNNKEEKTDITELAEKEIDLTKESENHEEIIEKTDKEKSDNIIQENVSEEIKNEDSEIKSEKVGFFKKLFSKRKTADNEESKPIEHIEVTADQITQNTK